MGKRTYPGQKGYSWIYYKPSYVCYVQGSILSC